MVTLLLAENSNEISIRFTPEQLYTDDGIALAVTGILVVFAALSLVVTFISVLPRIVKFLSAESTAPQPATEPAVADGELPQELIAVITAAVAETIRQPHRIVRIRGLTPADLGWSLEGRFQHHQSHRPQNRDR